MSKVKCLELFAGAGGLALGLEKAGFDSIGLIEFDHSAAETLRKNRPDWNVIEEDIANISGTDLEEFFGIKQGELDLLSGGSPCQSFSQAGKRLGLEDARGTLFYHYAIFLKKLQPKMFLFENVEGLTTHDGGKTFELIMTIFKKQGYNVQYKIVNAWDYGVPQKRKRIIIIGIRKDLVKTKRFIFPIKHHYRPVLRDALEGVPKSAGIEYSDYKKQFFRLVPPGGSWVDIPEVKAKEYMKGSWGSGGGKRGILRKLSFDEPSLTVLTSPGQKQTDRCHPTENRPFTVRENARIQTFPDEWEFSGSVSEQYKQIGNAVPVNLSYEIGKEIMKTLTQDSSWPLSFITKQELTEHIIKTIDNYGEVLASYDLKRLNKNIIDPVKLVFDANVYRTDWKTIVKNEIFRQRDKSNNNSIGYFHQHIFDFIAGCVVPKSGWDIEYSSETGITLKSGETVNHIYCELFNSHNTMNSSSAGKTFMKMQQQLLRDDKCACFLVEVIAKKSQDIAWCPSVDGDKLPAHNRIRRISIDKFLELLTGQYDAFYQLCNMLSEMIPTIVETELDGIVPDDSAWEELESLAKEKRVKVVNALYLLAFSTYQGF